ncbi:MAG: malonyl CoA-acyl carrier protein transacylase [Rhodothalassiaceae bacterium]|nr:MAG: malonyl CoA-acyl carrier protein transacylase [Rhodothalassiaceae bacterium]
MTRALLFPGQGSQHVGMGRALAEAFPPAREVFEEVDEALHDHLSRLMFEGPEDELTLTRNAQPALLAVSMAIIRTLESDGHRVPRIASFVAGHSLGEYSALTAAGCFALADAARLVRLRGEAMQEAVPVGAGAMAAVLGLDIDAVREIARAASTDAEICVVANDNAPGQVVVSGHAPAVERAVELAKERGAKRSVFLPVSAPFHSPLMAPAAERMRAALAEVPMAAPCVPVVTNVTASPERDPEALRGLLVEQVTAPVRWRESVARLRQEGVEEAVEIGAGRVLSGLVRRIDRELAVRNVEDPAGLEAFAATL